VVCRGKSAERQPHPQVLGSEQEERRCGCCAEHSRYWVMGVGRRAVEELGLENDENCARSWEGKLRCWQRGEECCIDNLHHAFTV